MASIDSNEPLAFFNAMQGAFSETIKARRFHPHFVRELSAQAFDSFNGNVSIQMEGQPPIACHPGCDACCVLRVVATAPEILLISQYVLATKSAYAKIDVDLAKRIAECDTVTGGLNEGDRLALQRHCPYIENGICLIYSARPLACRGHASYDKCACTDAAAGRGVDFQISMPHLAVRSLVQNALLSALRDAGLAWRLYELNKAVNLALSDSSLEKTWIAGEDPFVAAAIEIDAQDMATTFDAIKSR